jgi:hypothetical protein
MIFCPMRDCQRTISLWLRHRRSLKALVRKAAERTIDGLRGKIGEILQEFSPQECASYFTHAGMRNANQKML